MQANNKSMYINKVIAYYKENVIFAFLIPQNKHGIIFRILLKIKTKSPNEAIKDNKIYHK